MTNKKILILEDDDNISFAIKIFLQKKSFDVICKDTIKSAKEIIKQSSNIDLIVLDLNLPDGNGYDFCTYLKKNTQIPVIFLTVRDDDNDVIKGLDLGADDYIIKPFSLSVLYSRINAVLRRVDYSAQDNKDKIVCGNVTLDKKQTRVYLDNNEVALTAIEYRLLSILLENKNQTLTRTVLLEKLWDNSGNFVNDNTLTVTIKRLREKLNLPSFIKTVRGIGYRAEDIDEK